MRKFNHLTALQHLLSLDTTIFKEELYYPWYIRTHYIKVITASWFVLAAAVGTTLWLTTKLNAPTIFGAIAVISLLLGALFFATVKQLRASARNQAVSAMMRLEKKEFMRHLEPFVPDDRKDIAQRIVTDLDFTPKEYISVAVATQNRILHNTESLIKDIERMFKEKKLSLFEFDDMAFSDTVFAVTPKAREKYEKLKNASTFHDGFSISEQTKAAIMTKIREAANRAALGREG